MTTIECNVCIEESDLDTILSNLATLKTNIANWIEAKETAGEIQDEVMLGLSMGTNIGISMANINIDTQETHLYATAEDIQAAIVFLQNFVANLN